MKRRIRIGLFLVIAGCSGPTAADTGECTGIDCGPAFGVDFQPEGLFPQGTYRAEVTLDGQTHTCTATLPLDCSVPTCPDTSDVTLRRDGCTLGEPAQAVSAVEIWIPASQVSVELFLDDMPYGTGTYEPTYTEATIGEGGCTMTCLEAAREMMAVGL